MTAKKQAIKLLKTGEEVSPKELAEKADVSRQHASSVLNELRKQGKAIRLGSGPAIVYVKPGHDKISDLKFERTFDNEGLREHKVLEEAKEKLLFLNKLSENVEHIFDYAFSEMVNNAIEHSQSEVVKVVVGEEDGFLRFVVKDQGVGVFRDVMKKKDLDSELEAIQDLLKGKTTTEPEIHSGEGIFFTSKAAGIFILESFDYRLEVNNKIDDYFIEKMDSEEEGTKVTFRISKETDRELRDIFKKFQSDSVEYGFDKTEVRLKLYTMGDSYVSRSQARRVLAGLEKFRTIVLDFDKVSAIGQGFADEIFRVFKSKHPEVKVVCKNVNEEVQFMIDRAKEKSD